MPEMTPTQRVLSPSLPIKKIASLFTVKQDVETFLTDFFDEQIRRSQQLDERYTALWKALRQVTLAGGKRLRPYMAVLTYEAYGGNNYQRMLPVAVAHELLHTSLLIHDDIIDKDYIRHGKPNISGLFQQEYGQLKTNDVDHYASSAALLGGDLLLSAAYQVITECNLPDAQKIRSLAEINSSMFVVGGGEFLDTEAILRPFNDQQALQIAHLKTAYYSFASPLQSGAILAGVKLAESQQLAKFGQALGIAYQLADDILGLYGQEDITGKSNSGDIREGKRTYIMAQALQLAAPDEIRELNHALGEPTLSEREAARVRIIVSSCGAKAATEAMINQYVDQALAILQRLHIPASYKTTMRQIIQRATKRDY
jgi:geranylgeranyl diphosphate synthase type II